MENYHNRMLDVHREKAEARRRFTLGMTGLSTIAALAASVSFAPEAQAAPRRSSVATTYVSHVGYRDLDLSRQQDVLVLRQRLKVAARRLCRPTPAMIVHYQGFNADCFAQAMFDGMRQIDRAAYGARLVRRSTVVNDI